MCSICFENFKPYEDLYSTQCGHIYHFRCMQEWQSRSSCCPQCRAYKPKTHRIYLELKDMNEYDVKKFDDIQQQLGKYHMDMMKLKEDLDKSAQQRRDLEETLKDTLTHNEELRLRLKILEMKLKDVNNNGEHDVNNNNNNNIYGKPGAGIEQGMLQSNENERDINRQKLQQLEQQEPILQLESSSIDRRSIWFIRQTSQGDYQLKGPFKSISDAIIGAKKESLQETGLTIDGIDDTMATEWMDWLRNIYLSSYRVNTMLLEERDIIKTYYTKHARKLFIQFRTAEWRNRFLQMNNDNSENNDKSSSNSDYYCYKASTTPHVESGIRFTSEIFAKSLASYDTLYEYAKTLKLAGFKAIYVNRGNIFVRHYKNSPPILIKNKKQIDDLMNFELNL